MIQTFKNLSLALVVLTLENCFQPAFIAIPEELKDDINSSEAQYEKAQPKIYAQIESTNISSLNDSLLFALVESIEGTVKKNGVEKSLEPIQPFYSQPNVDLKLRAAIHPALKNTPWLHL